MMGARNTGCFRFSILFLCFSLNTHLSTGAGMLSIGESISGDQTLVSQGDGNFELGFFTPGNNNYYIGIWYRKIPERTVVWVANRDKPLSFKYLSQLKLLENGNLVILDSFNINIWSTSLIFASSNLTEAALLDSGNFVLRNVSNSSDLMWESFDHPTDTWLPGGKMGLNKHTHASQRLTSWKNSKDPASGFFSLEPDPAGTSEYFLLQKGVKYWSSGKWNGQIFSAVPEMRRDYIYDYNYVSNVNENYFTYSLYNASIFSRLVLDWTGEINQLSWLDGVGWCLFWGQPRTLRQSCKFLNLCRAFSACKEQLWERNKCECLQGFSPRSKEDYTNWGDFSGSCVRNTPLQCVGNASVNGERDGFLKMSNMGLPKNPQPVSVGSFQACEAVCFNSCSCNAYAYDGGCSVWEGDLLDLQKLSDGDISGRDLYLKLAAAELKKKGSATGVIVGAVSGVIALMGLLVMLIWMRRRRDFIGLPKAVEGYLVPFSYRNLKIATKSFSEKLGGGGFGSVFKGILSGSTIVAVKKLEGLSQGEKQFRSEISTIGMIQHVNLVRLRGFCCEGTRRLLVYDFMLNGSLDSHLFHGKKKLKFLDWKTRYQIALGTARGLAYLHEKCRECIIHCDIKPENILLDAEFCPKVADFGMAKLLGRDFSRALTTMRGTIGYLAPEWISGVAITAKADVYSYGMMLFELISGRRNSDPSVHVKVGYFPIWAANKINEDGEILSLLDDRLEGNVDIAELDRACKIASWCIQDDEVNRPSMGMVVQILEGIVEVSTPPIPRRLQALVGNDFSEPSSNHILQAL